MDRGAVSQRNRCRAPLEVGDIICRFKIRKPFWHNGSGYFLQDIPRHLRCERRVRLGQPGKPRAPSTCSGASNTFIGSRQLREPDRLGEASQSYGIGQRA